MKWFKHMANARNDPFLRELGREMGDTNRAYAAWFKLLEVVANHGRVAGGKHTGEITINLQDLSNELSLKTVRTVQLLSTCRLRGRLNYVIDANICTLTVCRFAEYADNYTRQTGRLTSPLQGTAQQLTSDLQANRLNRYIKDNNTASPKLEKQKEKDEQKHWQAKFEDIWSRYPRRLGKKQAEKHFHASVKTEEDWKRINAALDSYKSQIKNNGTEEQFIKHGSTWFNNWSDYVPSWSLVNEKKVNVPIIAPTLVNELAKKMKMP